MATVKFQKRVGRLSSEDWRRVSSVDVNELVHLGDTRPLQEHLDTLVFKRIDEEALRMYGHDASAGVVRLLQLTAEYLLLVQESQSA